MLRYAEVTIEKLDGTKEFFKTDPYDDSIAFQDTKNKLCWKTWGMTAVGYRFVFDNGREMIVHPNSVFRLIIDEKEQEKAGGA